MTPIISRASMPPADFVKQPLELGEAVRTIVGADPETWTGTLHIHAGGKTGELLYISGAFPAVRAVCPKAKICLWVHPAYQAVAENLYHLPDEVRCYTVPASAASVAEQVTWCLTVIRDTHHNRHWWKTQDGGLGCCVYWDHFSTTGPFYKRFARALGVTAWEKPWWSGYAAGGPSPVALVLATANQHAGGPRSFPVTPKEWEALAAKIYHAGLYPVMTGHPDDGRPESPGWMWYDGGPADVLALLFSAYRVAGLNSGMTWASLLLSPGKVTMWDSQEPNREKLRGAYDFSICTEVVDPGLHRQFKFSEFTVARLEEALL